MPFETLLPLSRCLMRRTCKVYNLNEISMLKKNCSRTTQEHEVTAQNLDLVPVLGWKRRSQLSQEGLKDTDCLL